MKLDGNFLRELIIFVIILPLVVIFLGLCFYCKKVNQELCETYMYSFVLTVFIPIGVPPISLKQIKRAPTKRRRYTRVGRKAIKNEKGKINFLMAISTKDYVILAADKANSKECRLGDKLTMVCAGEDGDAIQFGDWVEKNVRLHSICNDYELAPNSIHHWIRDSMALGLRSSESSYAVNFLIGGYDDYEGKEFLGTVDYSGNGIADQPYLFRGFPGRFCYAIMDRGYSIDMSKEKGMGLLKKCIAESKKKFVANIVGFKVVIIDKNGYRKLPDIGF